MQSHTDKELPYHTSSDTSEVDLYEYFNILFKYRKMIAYIVGVAFVSSIIISLLLPKMYLATTRILPPQETSTSIASLFSNSESLLSGMAGSLLAKQTPAALYVGILESRTVADNLNRKFNLKELYDLKYIEDVYKQLRNRSSIVAARKSQIISVSVKDRDPQRAADMANAYVNMLDQINRKLNTTEGRRKRVFLEERLKKVAAELEKAETALKKFQERYKLIAIEEQAKVSIEGAAEIKGQIIAAQTELEVLKQFGTEKQIEAVMLKTKIEELQKQLLRIEVGKDNSGNITDQPAHAIGDNFYIPFDDLPGLGMKLIRLTRETKIQEKVFELLTAQFEMAQIEEAKDVDTIQVLDVAVAPEKKYSPKRSIIVILSTIVAFLIAVCAAFAHEYWKFDLTKIVNGIIR